MATSESQMLFLFANACSCAGFPKADENTACVRCARPGSPDSFHCSASDTGTATCKLADGKSGRDRDRHWEKVCNRADCLGQQHRAAEKTEGTQLGAEGERGNKAWRNDNKNNKKKSPIQKEKNVLREAKLSWWKKALFVYLACFPAGIAQGAEPRGSAASTRCRAQEHHGLLPALTATAVAERKLMHRNTRFWFRKCQGEHPAFPMTGRWWHCCSLRKAREPTLHYAGPRACGAALNLVHAATGLTGLASSTPLPFFWFRYTRSVFEEQILYLAPCF